MAIVETLEVRFQADMGRLSAQLNQLAAQIGGISAALENERIGVAAGARGMIAALGTALVGSAALSTAPQQAAQSLAGRFAQGMNQGAAQAALAARNIVLGAKFDDPAALSGAVNAGSALGQGFANGIASKYGAVMHAANRIASAAVKCIRSALSIHSPSKVSFELGGYFGEGFADGVNASIRMAQRSVNALADASASALNVPPSAAVAADAGGIDGMVRRAVNEALGDMNITIPLNVDGVKLGEASIRGINRVTRSAGRLMLDI